MHGTPRLPTSANALRRASGGQRWNRTVADRGGATAQSVAPIAGECDGFGAIGFRWAILEGQRLVSNGAARESTAAQRADVGVLDVGEHDGAAPGQKLLNRDGARIEPSLF